MGEKALLWEDSPDTHTYIGIHACVYLVRNNPCTEWPCNNLNTHLLWAQIPWTPLAWAGFSAALSDSECPCMCVHTRMSVLKLNCFIGKIKNFTSSGQKKCVEEEEFCKEENEKVFATLCFSLKCWARVTLTGRGWRTLACARLQALFGSYWKWAFLFLFLNYTFLLKENHLKLLDSSFKGCSTKLS